MTTGDTAVQSGKSVWTVALASFAPVRHRALLVRVLPLLPLGLVLAVQAAIALRLTNSAFQDEALYVYTGGLILRSWAGGDPVYPHPEDFFSGAPMLYPVLAGVLDHVGGLELVRLFSLVCMMVATVAICLFTNALLRRPVGHIAGVLAALVFGWSAPVLFVSHLATFDAPAFATLAVAAAIAARAATTETGGIVAWGVVGVLCAVAVLTKYSAAIDVPFVFAVALVAAGRPTPRLLMRTMLGVATFAALLVVSFTTWAASLQPGLKFTTMNRVPMISADTGDLIRYLIPIAGPAIFLALAGSVVLLRRRPVVSLVLLAGALAAPVSQIRMGEQVSLHKHVVLGLIFGAPLAGIALSRMTGGMGRVVVLGAACWFVVVAGAQESRRLFQEWPNSTALVQEIRYSVDAMPWIRMVGEMPEPVAYGLADRLRQWQVTSTYEDSFVYQGKTGISAYRAALRDNHFQLVFLDGSTAIGRQLDPTKFGFRQTSRVATPYTGHAWRIYQRFDAIPE